jgi:hypothetical protein
MSSGIKFVLRFASSKNVQLQLRKSFSAFLSYSYNNAVKFLVILLCSNILLASTNHVVCIELSGERITKAHFQQYECRYPRKGESGLYQLQQEHETHEFILSDILGTTPSCPECIDEHIQFKKPSAKIDFSSTTLLASFPPAIQSIKSHSFLDIAGSSIPQKHRFPLFSFQPSIIRSTVLLV